MKNTFNIQDIIAVVEALTIWLDKFNCLVHLCLNINISINKELSDNNILNTISNFLLEKYNNAIVFGNIVNNIVKTFPKSIFVIVLF